MIRTSMPHDRSLVGHNSGRKYLAGLSLDDVLGNESKPPPPPPPPLYSRSPSQIRRTLWEIIHEHERGNRSYKKWDERRDRRTWRRFKDRLRLQHAGTTGSGSLEVPASDIPFQKSGSFSRHMQKRNHQKGLRSDKFSPDCHKMAEENYCGRDDQVCDLSSLSCSRPGVMRSASARYSAPVQAPSESDEPMPASTPEKASLLPQMMRHNSTKMGSTRRDSTRSLTQSESSLLSRDGPDFLGYGGESGRLSQRILLTSADDRQMSAREAVAGQEASEAEAAAAAAREEEQIGGLFLQGMTDNQLPARMLLMDLLEETDRQMGYAGSSYMIGEDNDDDNNEEEDEKYEEKAGEHSCSMCLVKHKGAPSGPCRHSFCKLCSKKHWVGMGNCPACNDFNLEIIEVF